jgi:hypothetical protein
MANVHYARIGDVWKHLPLAEVLSIECPGRYWESHAGSSSYPLTRSPERDYGVFLFLERGPLVGLEGFDLPPAPRLLRARQDAPDLPGLAPDRHGTARGRRGRVVFCDLDGASLANIAEDARALGVPSGRVRLVQGDGVSTLEEELAGLSEGEASGTFLHVYPYHPLEPGRAGETPLGLFAHAAERGVGCMLWYGFDATSKRAAVLDALRERIAGGAWYGEVSLRRGSLGVALRPGGARLRRRDVQRRPRSARCVFPARRGSRPRLRRRTVAQRPRRRT